MYYNETARNCLDLIERIAEKYGSALCDLPPLHNAHPGYFKPVSPEECAQILAMQRAGKATIEIAEAVGRPRDSITKVLRRNGVWLGTKRAPKGDSPEMQAAVREWIETRHHVSWGRTRKIAAAHGIEENKLRSKIRWLQKCGMLEDYRQGITSKYLQPATRRTARNTYATEVA